MGGKGGRRNGARPENSFGARRHIFGYGSLIWRPDFPHVTRRPALLSGYVRRFYQGSTDHRGVPGAPGRVVTLLPELAGETVGVAYELDEQQQNRIFAQLDERERGGYAQEYITVQTLDSGERLSCVVYRATLENPNFLGPAPAEEIATQILSATGPSGTNLDYLLSLDRALRTLGRPDPHVSELVEFVRSIP